MRAEDTAYAVGVGLLAAAACWGLVLVMEKWEKDQGEDPRDFDQNPKGCNCLNCRDRRRRERERSAS